MNTPEPAQCSRWTALAPPSSLRAPLPRYQQTEAWLRRTSSWAKAEHPGSPSKPPQCVPCLRTEARCSARTQRPLLQQDRNRPTLSLPAPTRLALTR
eukprot:4416250-Prymnesium_polylepis.1